MTVCAAASCFVRGRESSSKDWNRSGRSKEPFYFNGGESPFVFAAAPASKIKMYPASRAVDSPDNEGVRLVGHVEFESGTTPSPFLDLMIT